MQNKTHSQFDDTSSQFSNRSQRRPVFGIHSIICSDHQGNEVTHFCTKKECLKALCQKCIKEHNQHHKERKEYAEIETLEDINIQCQQILQNCLKDYSLLQEQISQQIQQEQQHSQSQQIQEKIIEAENQCENIVKSYFDILRKEHDIALRKMENEIQKIHLQLQDIESEKNKYKGFIKELQDNQFQVSALQHILRLDFSVFINEKQRATGSYLEKLNQAIPYINTNLENTYRQLFEICQNACYITYSGQSLNQKSITQLKREDQNNIRKRSSNSNLNVSDLNYQKQFSLSPLIIAHQNAVNDVNSHSNNSSSQFSLNSERNHYEAAQTRGSNFQQNRNQKQQNHSTNSIPPRADVQQQFDQKKPRQQFGNYMMNTTENENLNQYQQDDKLFPVSQKIKNEANANSLQQPMTQKNNPKYEHLKSQSPLQIHLLPSTDSLNNNQSSKGITPNFDKTKYDNHNYVFPSSNNPTLDQKGTNMNIFNNIKQSQNNSQTGDANQMYNTFNPNNQTSESNKFIDVPTNQTKSNNLQIINNANSQNKNVPANNSNSMNYQNNAKEHQNNKSNYQPNKQTDYNVFQNQNILNDQSKNNYEQNFASPNPLKQNHFALKDYNNQKPNSEKKHSLNSLNNFEMKKSQMQPNMQDNSCKENQMNYNEEYNRRNNFQDHQKNENYFNKSQNRSELNQSDLSSQVQQNQIQNKNFEETDFEVTVSNYFKQDCNTKYLHFFQPKSNIMHIVNIEDLKQASSGKSADNYLKFYDIQIKTDDPQFTIPRFHKSATLSDGSIFLIGGISPSQNHSKMTYKYDFTQNKLKLISEMITGRSGFGCVYSPFNNNIYVVGGACDEEGITNQCERYDVTNNKWSSISYLNSPTFNPAVCYFQALNGKKYIYKFGGKSDENNLDSVIERYDIQSDRWEIIPKNIQTPLFSSANCCQINNNTIIVFGGVNSGSQEKSNSCLLFCVNPDQVSKQQMVHSIKGINLINLPNADGFSNQQSLIHDNQLYALQNVSEKKNPEIIYLDRKRVICFNSYSWMALNNIDLLEKNS